MKKFQNLILFVATGFGATEHLSFEKTIYANFELIDLENGNSSLENEEIGIRNSFREIAHAKALMILYWQQNAEMEKRVQSGLSLKLTAKWMNCSVWESYLSQLPLEKYAVSERNHVIHILDFDCVPDAFRDWCSREPGRSVHVLYVLEKQFGHTVEMSFSCDSAIVQGLTETRHTWIYGAITAVIVLFVFFIYYKFKSRKRSYPSSKNDHSGFIPEQDHRFLTVPVNYRPRREDSGRKMMEARLGSDINLQRRKHGALTFKYPKTMEGMNRKVMKMDVPKIFVYGPDI